MKEKFHILNADKIELERQLSEINIMKELFKMQIKANERQPIEFLKLAQGHDIMKFLVCKQEAIISQIDTRIGVNQHLQIITEKAVHKQSLDDPDNDKARALDLLAHKLQSNASSKHRQKLFSFMYNSEKLSPGRDSTLK